MAAHRLVSRTRTGTGPDCLVPSTQKTVRYGAQSIRVRLLDSGALTRRRRHRTGVPS